MAGISSPLSRQDISTIEEVQGQPEIHPGSRVEDLPLLALSRPGDAESEAQAVLAADPTPFEASLARHALGIVLRDRGETASALRHLRAGLRSARAANRRDRETDTLATLGLTLALSGRTQEGLEALDLAASMQRGPARARVLMRRGGLLSVIGRHREAIADLTTAIATLRRIGDDVWESRARQSRALALLGVGAVARADADLARAESLLAGTGQELEAAVARQNRGVVAFRAGNLPLALRHLADAAERLARIGVTKADLLIDRGEVLRAAGLVVDAFTELEAGIRQVEAAGGVHAADRAQLVFAAGAAALACEDPVAARSYARAARRLFAEQQRDWWTARSDHLLVAAEVAGRPGTPALLAQAERSAMRLEQLGVEDAAAAHLLAGRIAASLGEDARADASWARCARSRRRGPALARSVGWLAEALRHQQARRTQRTLTSCRRGLEALDEHVATLGAAELRAHATGHGRELALLAQREALRRNDGRALLRWTERWRAISLSVPSTRPPTDARLAADLTALREVTTRVASDRALGRSGAGLQRERARLEAAVRTRALTQSRDGRAAAKDDVEVDDLRRTLAGGSLLELIDVDGDLVSVVADERGFRIHRAGPVAEATREVEFARFGLRRLAHGSRGAADTLPEAGERLERLLLGTAASDLGDGPFVVVPPGRFHTVPWGLLPALRDRPFTVAPSARVWLRGRSTRPPPGRRVTLVVGPGLQSDGREVQELTRRHAGATLLEHGSATVARVLGALDGAWLCHVAAHGQFRSDSPLFSSFELADGPLTVHDLQGLRRAPFRVVLSTCESAAAAPVGADELLGLISVLLPLGTIGLIAPITVVNDTETVRLSLAVHERLAAGDGVGEALLHARREMADDPLGAATAMAFLALGA